MSGYFDALMRSSGMTIDGPRPAPTHSESNAFEAAADPGGTAIETGSIDTPAMPPPAAFRGRESVEPAAPPREVQQPIAHQARANPDDAPARTRGVPDARAESPATPAVRSGEPSKPDLGARLVRATVRWIAEDTSTIGNVPVTKPSLPTPGDDARVVTAAPARDGDREPPSIVTQTVVAAKTIAREPAPQVRPPVERARADEPPQSPQSQAALTAQDETVEISIGAIHVRVDAPPAQTVARPAATPAANTPRAGALPPRSALSRRALRRI
jgi:hypothetical protein